MAQRQRQRQRLQPPTSARSGDGQRSHGAPSARAEPLAPQAGRPGNQAVQRAMRGGAVPLGLVVAQRGTLGNQAVQRLLRRARPRGEAEGTVGGAPAITVQRQAETAVVQRAPGDGHDLTAPRFAGDPVLEAVYDNEKLLAVGSRGSAVTKVQEALIEMGFPLPKFGADGVFGSETRTAVVNFQTDSGLSGKDVDGIIGPTTMGLLDKRASKPAPKPGPEPKPPDEEPVPEFILKVMENADPTTLAALRKNTVFLDSIQSTMTAAQFGKAAALLIVVVPDSVVSKEAAKKEAIRIVSTQLSGDKKVARGAIDKNIEVVVVPKNKLMTDLDQFKSLRGQKTFDGREWDPVRGSGGLTIGGKTFTAITEENLLGEECTATFKGKPIGAYEKGYSTSSHEFAHTLHLFVLDPKDRKTITDAYAARKVLATKSPKDPDQWVDGREGCYASMTEEEFFAQLSNAYLGTNAGTDPFTKDARHNGPQWVKDHEPTVYAILNRMYAGGSLPNTNPRP